MKLRVPDYYWNFACEGSDCKHNCCIGWEVDIDEETYEIYQNTSGSFGKRLQDSMMEGEEKSFRLHSLRCPFLNQENLCDIFIELGEENLCDVCTEYPRFTNEFPEVIEKGLGFSCEAVGRLVLQKQEPISFVEWEIEELDVDTTVSAKMYQTFNKQRTKIIELLQNREESILKRIYHALSLFQDTKNQRGEIKDIFLSCFAMMHQLEVMNKDSVSVLWNAEKRIQQTKQSDWKKFLPIMKERESIYEHICVSFIYRYFMQAVYDCDAMKQVQLMVFSFCIIIGLDFVTFLENGAVTIEDSIEHIRIYSGEVEHCQDNLDLMYAAFKQNHCFKNSVGV